MTWIFAYGSLMGDNAMRHHDGTPAMLQGFHRAFNHASTQRWGTPEHPCPVLGLSPGGECSGVAFEIPRSEKGSVFRVLKRREGQDEYRRRRERIRLAPAGEPKALVWVTKPSHLKTPRWPDDGAELERAFRAAHGVVGTGVEYIRTLIHALERWQIHDPLVETMWQALKPYSNPRG